VSDIWPPVLRYTVIIGPVNIPVGIVSLAGKPGKIMELKYM
jgi:hypothetical protein